MGFIHDVIGSLVPLLILFALFRAVISILTKSGRRRRPVENPMPEDFEEAVQEQAGRDLIESIERKLKAKRRTEEARSEFDGKVYKEMPKQEQPSLYTKSEPSVKTEADYKEKKKFTHRELVNGFIIAQVLGKPAALKPHDSDLLQ